MMSVSCFSQSNCSKKLQVFFENDPGVFFIPPFFLIFGRINRNSIINHKSYETRK